MAARQRFFSFPNVRAVTFASDSQRTDRTFARKERSDLRRDEIVSFCAVIVSLKECLRGGNSNYGKGREGGVLASRVKVRSSL